MDLGTFLRRNIQTFTFVWISLPPDARLSSRFSSIPQRVEQNFDGEQARAVEGDEGGVGGRLWRWNTAEKERSVV